MSDNRACGIAEFTRFIVQVIYDTGRVDFGDGSIGILAKPLTKIIADLSVAFLSLFFCVQELRTSLKLFEPFSDGDFAGDTDSLQLHLYAANHTLRCSTLDRCFKACCDSLTRFLCLTHGETVSTLNGDMRAGAVLLTVSVRVSCLPNAIAINYCTHISIVSLRACRGWELYLCARFCTHEHIALLCLTQEVYFCVSMSFALTSLYFGLIPNLN